MTKILKTSVSLIILSILSSPVFAVSLDDLQAKELDAISWTEFTRGSDTVLLNLFYKGSATEAVVTITNEHIRAFAPAGTADSSNFGAASSSYAFTASTTDTMVEVCDIINGLANYDCSLKAGQEDVLASYLRNQTAATGVNDLKARGGFDVKIDSQALSADGVLGAPWIAVSRVPASNKRVKLLKCDFAGSAGGGGEETSQLAFRIFGKLRQYEGNPDAVDRNNSTLAWGPVQFSSNTKNSINFDSNGTGGMEFAIGEPMIAVSKQLSTNTLTNQRSTDYVYCTGIEK